MLLVHVAPISNRHPRRKHLGARRAQMRERFVASEKVDHFHLVNLAWIHSFQRRKELIHRKADNDEIELFPDRRPPVQLVGSPFDAEMVGVVLTRPGPGHARAVVGASNKASRSSPTRKRRSARSGSKQTAPSSISRTTFRGSFISFLI
jgi:hypothetical protein